MMFTTLPRALVLLLVPLVACTVDLGLPGEARVDCRVDGDCPPETHCVAAVGRCVRGDEDSIAPALIDGSLSLSRRFLGLGQTLTVGFAVSEDLGARPQVTLIGGSGAGEVSLNYASDSPSERRYEYTLQSDGSEPQGDADLRVTLIDRYGNPGEARLSAQVFIDTIPPTLSTFALEIIPPESAGLATASRLTVGSRLRLIVAADENIFETSTATTTAPAALTLTLVDAPGPTRTFEASLPAAPTYPEGEYNLEIILRDEAGNSSVPTTTTFEIDTTPPPPPDGSKLHHRRVPWGADDPTEPVTAPRTLRGEAQAVEAGAQVRIADAAELLDILPVGVAIADENGGVPTTPLSGDAGRAVIVAIDGAGNVSSPTVVGENVWIASPAPSAPANPNRLRTAQLEISAPAEIHSIEPAPQDVELIRQRDAAGIVEVAGRGWRQRDLGGDGLDLVGAAIAYDAQRASTYAFGGFSSVLIPGSSLWRWDGARWHAVPVPGIQPEVRVGGRMVYHPRLDRLFLFGGGDFFTEFGGTWAFDGSLWEKVATAAASPVGRYHAGMAYDEGRDEVILFGGCIDGDCDEAYFADTWVWGNGAWRQETGAGPSARAHPAMAYDPGGGEVLLFGGCEDGEVVSCVAPLGDTWSWDGNAWRQRCTGASGEPEHCPTIPAARAAAAMSEDLERSGVLMFGGDPCPTFAETWRWNGASWEAVSTNDVSCRRDHGLVRDGARGQLLSLGGGLGRGGEVWTFAAAQWQLVSNGGIARPRPPGRAAAGFAYHPGAAQAVLIGGRDLNGPCGNEVSGYCDDLWMWDGVGWTGQFLSGTPTPRSDHALVYDSKDDRLIMIGGRAESACDGGGTYCDSLWELTPVNPWTWAPVQLCGSGTTACPADNPGPRSSAAVVYSTAEEKLFVFGGLGAQNQWADCGAPASPCPCWSQRAVIATSCRFADMRAFDGTSWEEICGGPSTAACGPTARTNTAFAYDEARDEIVMYGGQVTSEVLTNQGPCNANPFLSLCDETWVFREGAWELVCGGSLPACGPGTRNDAVMTYDPLRARIVMFGGNIHNDTWEWDGTSWKPLPVFLEATPRSGDHGMAFIPSRASIALFGGAYTEATHDSLWEFQSSPENRPSVLASFAWGEAGVTSEAIETLTVSVSAGARGYTTEVAPSSDLLGNPSSGVELWLWNARLGAWAPMAAQGYDLDAPGSLEVMVVDDPTDFVSPFDQTVHALILPSARSGNGPEEAKVIVDYVSLEVRYRFGP